MRDGIKGMCRYLPASLEFLKRLSFKICVGVQCQQKPEGGVRSSGTEVTGTYEPPDRDLGTELSPSARAVNTAELLSYLSCPVVFLYLKSEYHFPFLVKNAERAGECERLYLLELCYPGLQPQVQLV